MTPLVRRVQKPNACLPFSASRILTARRELYPRNRACHFCQSCKRIRAFLSRIWKILHQLSLPFPPVFRRSAQKLFFSFVRSARFSSAVLLRFSALTRFAPSRRTSDVFRFSFLSAAGPGSPTREDPGLLLYHFPSLSLRIWLSSSPVPSGTAGAKGTSSTVFGTISALAVTSSARQTMRQS